MTLMQQPTIASLFAKMVEVRLIMKAGNPSGDEK